MKYSNWWKIDWTWFDCIENSANLKQGGQYSNPWPGQYLTHMHSDIMQAVAATDSCFILIGAHQCGKAIGLINGEKKFQQANARVGWKWSTQRLVEDRTELSLRAVTCNTCYGWAHLMLRVIKVESKRWYYKFCEMLWVNLDLLQLLQNLMTALQDKQGTQNMHTARGFSDLYHVFAWNQRILGPALRHGCLTLLYITSNWDFFWPWNNRAWPY